MEKEMNKIPDIIDTAEALSLKMNAMKEAQKNLLLILKNRWTKFLKLLQLLPIK